MYCLVVTDDYSRFTWVFFLATKDETSGLFKSFITKIENLVDHKVKVIRCDNGTKFKNREINQFCEIKGILRQFSVARTPQQNGVVKRKNKTLIEAARTMLANSKLPTTFLTETVNTACYVQNRVLVVKPHNKTPYENFHGRTPTFSFMRPFRCPVAILNTIDHLGKFDGKADEGFFVGYSLDSKAFRVFISRTRIMEENLHIRFSETTPNDVDDGKKVDEDPRNESESKDQEKEDNVNSSTVNAADHPLDQVIRDLQSATQTRRVSNNLEEHGFISTIQQRTNHKDLQNCLFACFLSHEELKKVIHALKDPSWIEAIQEVLLQFKLHDVWTLVDLPNGKKAVGFEDPDFSNKVYKIEKTLYRLHQAPRAWYDTLSTYLLDNGFQREKINKTLFIKRHKGDILLMSSIGELTFFLGLQVKQKKDGIFISQDKYVVEILKKFGFTEVKIASTPRETQKPLLRDEDGKEVDVHMYRNKDNELSFNPNMPALEDVSIFNFLNDEDDGIVADMNNLDTTIQVSPILTIIIHKDHHLDQVIRDFHPAAQTRNMSMNLEEHGFVSTIQQRTNLKDLQNCLFACFLLQEESKKVYRNKKDERGIVIRNKARLVAQIYTQEEGVDYDEVFAPVGRIEAIRLFLAYASFKDFMVYQMDVKGAFLYRKIEKEVYKSRLQAHLWKLKSLYSKIKMDKLRKCQIDDGKAVWNRNGVNTADGKKIIITEASIRGDIQLADEEGVNCLLNSTIFEQLALMSPMTTAWNEFSSTMASTITCLATNQEFDFSKWIFDSMIRNLDNVSGKFLMYPRVGKGISGRVTPLFPTMVVQSELGEGSAMPTDPHHTPTILQSSSSQPQKTHKPRKPIRKVTQVPQPSDLMEHVVDEAVHKELGDSLVRAATTDSSLEAEQDGGNINKTQSKATPNEPSSQRTNSGGGPMCQEAIGDTTAQTRNPTRKVTQVPQPSDPMEHVVDEAIHKELGDSLVRAATIASSLEAEQDIGNINKTQSKGTPNESRSQGTDSGGGPRCQEIMRVSTAQTRFESVSKHSNDSLLARGNTLQSDKDSMKLNELMELCTTIQNRVLELEKANTSQHNEIVSLKRGVKKLEKRNKLRTHKLKRLYKVSLTARVESSDDEESLGEDASKQERIEAIDADEDITLVNDQDDADKDMFDEEVLTIAWQNENIVNITTEELTLAQTLEALKTSKPKVKGLVIQEPVNLQQQQQFLYNGHKTREERLARKRAVKEQEANIALIETWNDIHANINVDHQLAERMQAQEQEELSDAEKDTLFQQLLEKKRKHFAAKRAEEKRNKPSTQAQKRKIMCTYLKNMEGYKLKDLKLKEFDKIQEMFGRAFKRVNTFEDIRTELVKEKEKRAGEELIQESTKKQKVEDNKEIVELKQLIEIIPDKEEVAIDAIPLAVKSPRIVD
uniref:Retrovirus-related Pol polyprotein from transposon TNT 1-94 n=1 Tax=Tanacetum cinerariifolium TaxID=118510 RepID=A0A6L2JKJ0_TANCI|nr:retrovirus-related Pol polyprotein from transposon TNT 1-94 [Tanacetum cinerariifolium]